MVLGGGQVYYENAAAFWGKTGVVWQQSAEESDSEEHETDQTKKAPPLREGPK